VFLRLFPAILAFLTVVACPWLVTPAQESPRPPNVVVILVDDLGWADLGCYGCTFHETPHIDRLARESVRFLSAYAAAPVCTPTRAALMTGKHPTSLGITIWYEAARRPMEERPLIPPMTVGDLPLSETTLGEILHQRGYFTAHMGKWHLGSAAYYPEAQGFDLNMGGTFWGAPATHFFPYRGAWSDSRSSVAARTAAPASLAASRPSSAPDQEKEIRYVPDLPLGREGEYLTDRLTDEAMKVLVQVKDRPFYLNLCYYAVHTPIEGKPALVAHYDDKAARTEPTRNAGYAAMVHSLDENIGRLMAALDELNLRDNTLVVFTSDNGGFVSEYKGRSVTTNAPLRSGKGSVYEGGLRVPLLIRWPKVAQAGTTCAEPVVTMDLFTTIARAAGARPSDEAIAGLDLRPLLTDPSASLDRDTFYFHFPHYYPTTTPVGAIREGDWKLIEYFEDGRLELYDLASDLSEQHDLAGQKPEVARRLHAKLAAWRQEVAAPMPTRRGD
jgi:arylsulfatase A